MKNLINLTFLNTKKIFSRSFIIMILVLFMVISLYRATAFEKSIDFLDFYLYSFFTSLDSFEKINEVFIWSLYQFSFIVIIAKFIGNELSSSNIFYFIRSNNKFKWLLSIEFTLVIISTIYHFSAFSILYIFYMISSKVTLIALPYELIWLVLLLILSSMVYANIYIILIIFFRKNISTLLYVIFFIYTSLYIGISININEFLPFNQIIISNMYSNINTIIYRNIYLLLFNILLSKIYIIYVFKNDLNKIIN